MGDARLSFGIVMLLQTGTGLSVNAFLLLFYARVFSTSHRLSSSDLIQAQLPLANIIILLTGAVPDTLSFWELRIFLDDVLCKLTMYLYRVARGLAICTVCLLSVFQAITISPSTARWARYKAKLPRCFLPASIFSWVLNLLINGGTPMCTTGPANTTFHSTYDLKYCTLAPVSTAFMLVNTILYSASDLSLVGLMSLASGYMVLVLHRHHRRVRHLHGPDRSPGAMPEVRAAKRVVALATLFVLLYGRQSVMLSILLNVKGYSVSLLKSHLILSFAFSVFSPFLMICSDQRVRSFWKRESIISNLDPS
ncbi:olfactory receptor class A-like protein 1 [Ornithorhynchus anatinus]|uniref:Vomeronasal type-1 receptor n=1 Tax=Ornithorhynchus anatinus TaxID=9258 RepID=A0A6I8P9X1_ORNAN|nr:olfactory receptor class A-like protein 1 [Ornithorhynchus anatinus]